MTPAPGSEKNGTDVNLGDTSGGGEPGHTEKAARWIYSGVWRVLVDWFHVPDRPPSLPIRPGEGIEAFQPAEGFLRYMKLWFWIVAILIDIAIAIGYIAATVALAMNNLVWLAVVLLPVAVVIAFAPDLIAYVAIHLRYDTTWYVMTERSLRIRRGIWVIQETTITIENVQNMKVTQGPVQRYFGISNLIVETAGSGAGKDKPGHGTAANLGIIEGVADANRLRDLILPRLRHSRSAGLGDEEHESSAGPTWTPAHLDALREIRDEIVSMSA